MSPEDYRDTWQPMPPRLWLRYPSSRAQAMVCWYAGGTRPDWAPPPTFKRLPASIPPGVGETAAAQS
jgi:hypothetical protein